MRSAVATWVMTIALVAALTVIAGYAWPDTPPTTHHCTTCEKGQP